MQLDPKLVQLIVVVVVLAWVGLTVASVVDKDIEVPAQLNTIFMALAGGGVALGVKGKKPDGGDGGEGGDK